MEILAPCGGPEHVEPAVSCGADAVYLGGDRLSARGSARNFTPGALEEAVRVCHRNGVRVYLAVNTLLSDGEEGALLETLDLARALSVDALIMQDWGAADFARRKIPGLPLHASTQCSIHTPGGAALARELGFSRVVLARELDHSQIREITRRAGIECEIFIHGALCGGVSGQCLFSAALGERSGNRGFCAQPCRLDTRAGERAYALSLRDLSLIHRMEELRELGVVSLKIEGRMKRPEYAAAAVTACRMARNGETPDLESLRAVFSRSGFTDAYFTGTRRDMGGIRRQEDVLSSQEALPALARLSGTPVKRRFLDLRFIMLPDEPSRLEAREGDNIIFAEGDVPQIALRHATTAEEAERQLCRLGDTPFQAVSFAAGIGEGLMLPLSRLNALRRALCERLYVQNEAAMTHNYEETEEKWDSQKAPRRPLPGTVKTLRGECRTAEQWEALSERGGEGSLPLEVLLGHPEIKPDGRLMAALPRWTGGREDETRRGLALLRERGFENLLCHNIGHIALGRETGFRLHGGWGLNIMNHRALEALARLGLADAALSFELRLNRSPGGLPSGRAVYGRMPLMLLCRCPVRDAAPRKGCGNCPGFLTDRKGRRLPLRCDGHSVEVLNPDTLWMADRLEEIREDTLWLLFDRESGAEVRAVLDACRTGAAPPERFTRGVLTRGVR